MIHTLGGVNYNARRMNGLWYCRWELPTTKGGDVATQLRGDNVGPYPSETDAVKAAQEDFAGSAAEPVNTEHLNDR